MTAKLSTIVIDCANPIALADFWRQALNWEHRPVDDGQGEVEIGPRDMPWPTILFEPVQETKAVKNRVHLDLNPLGVDQDEELERLLALGARRVDIGQLVQTWIVLADPEGNEFCLLRDRG